MGGYDRNAWVVIAEIRNEQIVSGRFDSVSLENLTKEVEQLLNGKEEFNRYRLEPELQEEMRKSGRILAAAGIICRADESSGAKHAPGTYEFDKETGERQVKLLERYAKATGCWFGRDFTEHLDMSAFVSIGGEAEVYRASPKNVLKLHTLAFTVSPQKLIDRIIAHNTMFGGTRITLKGFGRNSMGEFCFIYNQPFVQGKCASEEEIRDMLNSIGREKIEEYTHGGINFKTSMYLFDDFHCENVIKDKFSGQLFVIDSDLRFNTPELGLGGKFIIPPVEDDFKIRKRKVQDKSESTNYRPKF